MGTPGNHRTKAQHYVAQFYLRGFANEKEMMFCYDKKAANPIRLPSRPPLRSRISTKSYPALPKILFRSTQSKTRSTGLNRLGPHRFEMSLSMLTKARSRMSFWESTVPTSLFRGSAQRLTGT